MNGEPGISGESMRALSDIVADLRRKEKHLVASLAFDEMSIRHHVQWSDSKKKFLGYISYSSYSNESNDGLPVARNALVFLLSGIDIEISLPVAHYFITTLNAQEKAKLLESDIASLTEIG